MMDFDDAVAEGAEIRQVRAVGRGLRLEAGGREAHGQKAEPERVQ
jgi:hypothetical protein